MMKLICILCVLVSGAFGLNNGLGLKPQMGWNSWNHFACNISDRLVRQTVDVIVSNGLDKWYKYVNIDDCWASFKRDANGIIIPDDDFPNMTALAEYIHSKGLLFGLYTSVGPKTCMGRAGSFGYETQDASTYAKWGVDYLKYDFCYSRKLDPTKRYPLMRDALNKTGRPIFLSMSEGGRNDPAMWARPMSNSWRTTKDIKDYWERMISRADENNEWWSYAGPGGWNDPDMLEVGNGNMTTTEYITHFSLWALMKAPLLIGCDVHSMSDDTLKILTNEEVIAINQDDAGIQGHKMKTMGTNEIWAGPLANGDMAVILLNRGMTRSSITFKWSSFGAAYKNRIATAVRDLWAHKDLGRRGDSVTADVESHGVVMYRISFDQYIDPSKFKTD